MCAGCRALLGKESLCYGSGTWDNGETVNCGIG